jgi:hypothetical protein
MTSKCIVDSAARHNVTSIESVAECECEWQHPTSDTPANNPEIILDNHAQPPSSTSQASHTTNHVMQNFIEFSEVRRS